MPATLSTCMLGLLRQGVFALALGATALTAGCSLMDKTSYNDVAKPSAKAPMGMPSQVVAVWQNKVYQLPDPTRNGEPGTGLVGRVFLFPGGSKALPVACDGTLTVEMYNDRIPGAKGPVKVEAWVIKKDTLKRMLDRDEIGWGYTMFLPSTCCTPNATHVHMNVCFTPEGAEPGARLYSASTPMHLDFPDQLIGAGNVTPVGYGQATPLVPTVQMNVPVLPAGYQSGQPWQGAYAPPAAPQPAGRAPEGYPAQPAPGYAPQQSGQVMQVAPNVYRTSAAAALMEQQGVQQARYQGGQPSQGMVVPAAPPQPATGRAPDVYPPLQSVPPLQSAAPAVQPQAAPSAWSQPVQPVQQQLPVRAPGWQVFPPD